MRYRHSICLQDLANIPRKVCGRVCGSNSWPILCFWSNRSLFVQRCGPSSHVILWSICPFLIQVDDGKGGCFDNPYWRFEFHKEEGEHSDGMNAWWMLIHASLIVQEPFMNSRIRRMLYFLHRGSNAEAGRKTAEGFSGRIHCFRGKCEDFLKIVICLISVFWTMPAYVQM